MSVPLQLGQCETKASSTLVDIAYRSDLGSAQHMVVNTRENGSQTLRNHFLKYPQLSDLISMIWINKGDVNRTVNGGRLHAATHPLWNKWKEHPSVP
jgi:hypothetical protein